MKKNPSFFSPRLMKGALLAACSLFIHCAGYGQFVTTGTPTSNTVYTLGKVGIGVGTNALRGQLDVAGTGNIWLTSSGINSGTQAIYLPGEILVTPYNGGNIAYFQARRSDNSGSTAFQFRTWNNGSPTDAMFISSTGNIGIGTNNFSEKLHVNGNIVANNLYWGNNSSTLGADQGGSIELGGNVGQLGIGMPYIDFHYTGLNQDFNTRIHNDADGRLSFYASTAYYSGNLLVGKTTQQNTSYKLDVNGAVRANSIVVNTTGADFVFEKNYQLRPLSEVESFIKANNHLPEIAPAAQMQKEGVNVGELQTQLLQKIEELTLYMIEQNKKIESQSKKIETLEKQLTQSNK